jgi:C_GCAxxG_C_C family probable redox protein
MDRSEKALEYFDNKFNCAQSVLAAFTDIHGLTEDESLRVACAFGGGMGRQQHTCGAVTGAAMAIGMVYGKAKNDNDDRKQETYNKTVAFFNQFASMHGSTNCMTLLKGLNMNDPVDMEVINQHNLFATHCRKYVTDAVRLIEKIIDETNQDRLTKDLSG